MVEMIDYWSDLAAQVEVEIDADMAQLEAWLVNEDVVLLRESEGISALSRDELRSLMPMITTRLRPRIEADAMDAGDLRRALRTARLRAKSGPDADERRRR